MFLAVTRAEKTNQKHVSTYKSVSKSKIHHLLNYVGRKKEIPRISFIFLGWPNLPTKSVCHKYQIIKMPRKTRNLLTAKLKRAFIKCFEEFKRHDELRPKRLSTVLFHNPTFF
jgi:hypothetical protein